MYKACNFSRDRSGKYTTVCATALIYDVCTYIVQYIVCVKLESRKVLTLRSFLDFKVAKNGASGVNLKRRDRDITEKKGASYPSPPSPPTQKREGETIFEVASFPFSSFPASQRWKKTEEEEIPLDPLPASPPPETDLWMEQQID